MWFTKLLSALQRRHLISGLLLGRIAWGPSSFPLPAPSPCPKFLQGSQNVQSETMSAKGVMLVQKRSPDRIHRNCLSNSVWGVTQSRLNTPSCSKVPASCKRYIGFMGILYMSDQELSHKGSQEKV